MNDADIKAYTGIVKSIFNVMVETVDQFPPLNYWSGKPVKHITPEDQLLLRITTLKPSFHGLLLQADVLQSYFLCLHLQLPTVLEQSHCNL